MVYVSYIVASFLVCLGLSFLIMLFYKSKLIIIFSFFFLFLSGFLLLSTSTITSESILFYILGFIAISIILLFMFRDELKSKLPTEINKGDANE